VPKWRIPISLRRPGALLTGLIGRQRPYQSSTHVDAWTVVRFGPGFDSRHLHQ
jgi:hypothetical protein